MEDDGEQGESEVLPEMGTTTASEDLHQADCRESSSSDEVKSREDECLNHKGTYLNTTIKFNNSHGPTITKRKLDTLMVNDYMKRKANEGC